VLKRRIPLRKRSTPAVRNIKCILQRRDGKPQGTRESRAYHARRRPGKGGRLRKRSPEERSGVGGTECGARKRWHKGDRKQSVAHLRGNPWDKTPGEVQG